jgi:hypothetical protein
MRKKHTSPRTSISDERRIVQVAGWFAPNRVKADEYAVAEEAACHIDRRWNGCVFVVPTLVRPNRRRKNNSRQRFERYYALPIRSSAY